jgi:putative copper export protein
LDPRDIVDSTYGRIVLAKLLIYCSIIPLAWLNRSTYLPAIVRRPDSATHLLRQYVYRELFLVVAIVALTAWLINTSPVA